MHRADVGLLPAEYAEAIAAACRADDFDPAAIGIAAASSGNPVAPLVRLLTTNVRRAHGEPAAGWVHHGATSQDVADTAMMLLVRDAIQVIVADVAACADRCAELARKHEHTLLAGRTLLQQALPTTFGLKAAGWLHALDEAAAELRRVSSTLPAQLGGAAGRMASMGDDGLAVLAAYAGRLDLAEPRLPWHAHRLPVLRIAGAGGLTGAVAGKIARDVVPLTHEVGEAHDGTPGRGGSSTLPHKQNPVAAISVLAATGQLPGLMASLMGRPATNTSGGGKLASGMGPAAGTSGGQRFGYRLAAGLSGGPGRRRGSDARQPCALRRPAASRAVAAHLTLTLGRLAAHDLVETVARTAVASGQGLLEVLLTCEDGRGWILVERATGTRNAVVRV